MAEESSFRSMKEIMARMEARARGEQVDPPRPEDTRIIPLPTWPAGFRGVPNGILRSALFGTVKRGRRAYQEKVVKASLKGIMIKYTGYQLDQADLDVWEYCLHLSRRGIGARIEFATHGFLKGIGRNAGGKDGHWLISSLTRLHQSLVQVDDDRFRFMGSLIRHFEQHPEGNVITLSPGIKDLYDAGWTQIEWEQREKLKGHQLAQWLHGFYCTHAKPHLIRVSTLHKLSGSDNRDMSSFRQKLRAALSLIAATIEWKWEIDKEDLVHIHKPPTESQARHLDHRIHQ